MKIFQRLNQPDHQGYSVEFYPPRTPIGEKNLQKLMSQLASLERPPLFWDITWGAGGTTSELTLKLALSWTQTYPHIPINMHLTTSQMSISALQKVLDQAQSGGIKNLVLLRGDHHDSTHPPTEQLTEFENAQQLVSFVRQTYGSDEFGITVAGYPEGHPSQFQKKAELTGEAKPLRGEEILNFLLPLSADEQQRLNHFDQVCSDERYQSDLAYLASKNGDLIISQMFFDPNLFLKFVQDCRTLGITVPILPGILIINSLAGFQKMIQLCQTKVPSWLLARTAEIEQDTANSSDQKKELAVKLGIDVAIWLIRALYTSGIRHFHLYTLNSESVLPVIEEIIGLREEEI